MVGSKLVELDLRAASTLLGALETEGEEFFINDANLDLLKRASKFTYNLDPVGFVLAVTLNGMAKDDNVDKDEFMKILEESKALDLWEAYHGKFDERDDSADD